MHFHLNAGCYFNNLVYSVLLLIFGKFKNNFQSSGNLCTKTFPVREILDGYNFSFAFFMNISPGCNII